MSGDTLSHRLYRILRARASTGVLKIPPPCFDEMKGAFTAFDEGQRLLTARFPVDARYQNPLGYMQGGFITAAIDNTLGPLSYLVAPPSVTLQLSTQYLRPVAPGASHIVVHGRVDEMTKSYLFMSARVLDPRDRVVAIAQAHCQILPLREAPAGAGVA
jgi:uncharacterized protein (TIGR00369 family)